jgi:CubicO group peptidase (beta-lactamase class C family)
MGLVAPGFEPVEELVRSWADADPSYDAQVVAHHRGELVVDLTTGSATPDGLLPVFSSSKGATAIVVALLVQRGQLDLDARVSSYWPEFAAKGKREVTVRQLLSHQAGLHGVDGGFTYEEWYAHTPLAERLAAQRPFWQPGQAFLYHALTIGTLADELVRRTDGRTVAQVLADDVTGPRGIDVWMGTPASEDHRVVEVLLPSQEELLALMASMPTTPAVDGLSSQSSPTGGAMALLQSANTEPFRRAGAPAAGALASARGLAKLYACLTHDVDGPRLLEDDTIAQMTQVQAAGAELGNGLEARFGVIFQSPCPPRWAFGSFRAFGHDGAGGSLAVNDPAYDLAVGYTVRRVPLPDGLERRPDAITRVLRECLAA